MMGTVLWQVLIDQDSEEKSCALDSCVLHFTIYFFFFFASLKKKTTAVYTKQYDEHDFYLIFSHLLYNKLVI